MQALPLFTGVLSLIVSGLYPLVIAASNYPVERLGNVPDGWMKVQPTLSSKLMKFQLGIHQENAAEFEQKVINLSTPGHNTYGHHMKLHEIQDFLRPSDDASDSILSWLQAEQVPAESIENHGNWITFTVPVSQAESLLGTKFYDFRHQESGTIVTRALEYSVPETIYPYIHLIQPTTRFGRPKPQVGISDLKPVILTEADLSGNCSTTITPECLRELYRINDTNPHPDPRNILGISGFLEEYARYDDFYEFMQRFGPDLHDANFSVEYINGGLNLQDSAQSSTEAALDIQYAASIAYNSITTFYTTAGRGPLVPEIGQPDPNNTSNEPYLEQLHYLINLPDEVLPAVLSTSYGEDEQSLPASYLEATCNLFAQLAARGVSRFLPAFPASCPFVTSVGGTYGINPEKAIGFSGGGFSERFARPSYQDASIKEYFNVLGDKWEGLYNKEGRGIPDVALQAKNFAIIDHGAMLKTGGTSASAPVFAGIVSRLNAARLQQNKPRLGFLNPWLYSLRGNGFTDIVHGGSLGGADLRTLVSELHNALNKNQLDSTSDILSRAKRALLLQNALIPTPSTSPEVIAVAREVLELGALAAIRQTDAPTFTRYYQQLQPFYDLERDDTNAGKVDVQTSQRSKITGLYLLLLLSMGDSTSFHTVLEGLVEEASLKGKSVEDDPFIKYPVDLERNLMEGSYDKVWRETNSERVPSGEFALFSNVLVGTIRSEIADCSEKAYPSLPISNAKNLLFLESEGAVIDFAQHRGWVLRDGRIYFPVEPEAAARSEKDILVASGTIIENAIGYARELETIV
ncbi:peptidase S8/S53 domain-containing protein [Aspergillus ambiguus]|uniref:peptidase S8/S53 domain-containing protein n=1 Tax=Aspergillus ambiguus TaxID=176160 RepID=UPI003CCDE8A2